MSSVTSSSILTPEFQLQPGRCNVGCTVMKDRRLLTNLPPPKSRRTGQSGPRPCAFLGSCGLVDLTQPALHYWAVASFIGQTGSGDRCEFGLASLASLDTCGEGQRISDCDVNAATLVLVRDGDTVTVEGRNWTKDLDTPPPPQGCDVTYTCLWEKRLRCWTSPSVETFYTTFGLLYDNRQPQSPRLLVVENGYLLGVRRLSSSPDLRPVVRVWPCSDYLGGSDACLEVKTGPGIQSDFASRQMQSLLGRIDGGMTSDGSANGAEWFCLGESETTHL